MARSNAGATTQTGNLGLKMILTEELGLIQWATTSPWSIWALAAPLCPFRRVPFTRASCSTTKPSNVGVLITTVSWGKVAPPRIAPPWNRLTLGRARRSEEHTSELQSLLRTTYDCFCLQQQN